MTEPKFKRIRVKRVRDELRIEGQGSTRSGQHFVKRFVSVPVEGRSIEEQKRALKKGLEQLFDDTPE